jgi:predicted dithiol-disulfide oxidoreductase (DUF899 family)
MPQHTVGTREEWQAARAELLEREKQLTRLGDELARERRRLPWVPVDKAYVFETDAGTRTLAELFDGRSQLLVYHFMFGPDWTAGCVGCSFVADHVDGAIVHVNARDVTMVFASRAPFERLQAYKRRMGWSFDWVSTLGSDFNFDFGVSSDAGENAGLSAFALEDGVVYHTYSTYDRGLEILDGAYHLLDRAPKGRDEDDLPHPAAWWRRHDEYVGAPA